VRFLSWVTVNALALAVAVWLLPGIQLTGATTSEQVIGLVVVALVFGLVNAIVRPVVALLSLPFIILTLGLLLLVINALMLLLTSWIAGQLGAGFHVDSFWTAVVGAVVITLATWALEIVIPDGR
jgi:putative membrane protein